MTEEIGVEKSSDWKKFMRKHWKIVAVFAVAAILAFASVQSMSFSWFTRRCSNNRFSSINSGSLDNGKCSIVYSASDFLGTHIHRNPSNHRCSNRLAMVEKTT